MSEADDISRYFSEVNKRHEKMDAEFRRLCVEPCQTIPEVGDTAIVAVGLLSMGYLWIRQECEVLAVADTSVKVRIGGRLYPSGYTDEWIHPSLITDVIKKEKQCNSPT